MWRDDILEASFRGVPFFVSEHERVSGRRVVVSEMPFRDLVATEDLGRGVRKFEVTAYVLGEDYFANRDALLAACEDNAEPGTLVHPYLGELRVRCQTVRLTEQQNKGRLATFLLGFVESGEEKDPAGAISTRAALLKLARAVLSVGRRIFGLVNTLRNMPPNVLLGFLGEIAVERLGAWAGLPGISLSRVRGEIAGMLSSFNGPPTTGAVADRTVAPFTAMAAAALAAPRPAASGSAASSAVGAVAPTSRGEGEDPARRAGFLLLAYVSPAGPPANQLQAAIRDLARTAEIVAAAEIFAGIEWPNAAEAEAARQALLDAVDRAAEAAADAGFDELYAAWSSFGTAAAIDMAERAMQAPRLVEYAVPRPISALVLAHRLYQDAARADELVALGGAPHPAFLPPTGPALAQ